MPERGRHRSQATHSFIGTSGQHEWTIDRGVSVPVPESWYAASLLALTENAFGASASRRENS
jgi:hypothetical protein